MNGWMRTAVVGLAAVVSSGCLDSMTTLKVARDGSAKLVVVECMAPQLMAAMSGMGQALGAPGGEGAKPADPAAALKTSAEAKARAMGPGVTLESFMMTTNAAGWAGYTATYGVKDVNQITRLGAGDVPKQGEAQAEGDEDKDAFKITFKRGPVCELTLTPLRKKSAAPSADAAKTDPEQPDKQAMEAAMMPAMAAMFQGMRIGLNIEVEGRIVETNGKFKEGDRTLVLMDVPMGKLMANPEVQKIMSAGGSDTSEKLAALKIEGLKIEEPGKAIQIKFK